MANWIDERIAAELAKEERRREVLQLTVHTVEVLKREIPVLWREIYGLCQSAVDTFNREFQLKRVASIEKDSANSFRVQLHRPGSSMMSALLVIEGYRIDYTLYRDNKTVDEALSKIAFHLDADGVFPSAEGRRIDADGAVRVLLEAVLFGE